MILKASECEQRRQRHLVNNVRNRGSDFFILPFPTFYLKIRSKYFIRSGEMNSSCDIRWCLKVYGLLNIILPLPFINISALKIEFWKRYSSVKRNLQMFVSLLKILSIIFLLENIQKGQKRTHTHTNRHLQTAIKIKRYLKENLFYWFIATSLLLYNII